MTHEKTPSCVVAGGDERLTVAASELAERGVAVTLCRKPTTAAEGTASPPPDPLDRALSLLRSPGEAPLSPLALPTEGRKVREGASATGSLSFCHRLEDCPSADLLLLPIPVSRDGVHLCGEGAPTVREAEAVLGRYGQVAGGGISASLTEAARKAGAEVWDLLEDPPLVLANARLTAEAALGYALLSRKDSPAHTVVLVIGFGRIGAHLTRLLASVGFVTRVVARRAESRREARELGAEAFSVAELARASEGAALLFNTVPAPLLSDSLWEGMTAEQTVVELAGGRNLSPPEGARPSLVRLPSLPGRVYPRAAGRLVAEAAFGLLFHIEDNT